MPFVVFGNEDDGSVGAWDRIDWFRGPGLVKSSFLVVRARESSRNMMNGLALVPVNFWRAYNGNDTRIST